MGATHPQLCQVSALFWCRSFHSSCYSPLLKQLQNKTLAFSHSAVDGGRLATSIRPQLAAADDASGAVVWDQINGYVVEPHYPPCSC